MDEEPSPRRAKCERHGLTRDHLGQCIRCRQIEQAPDGPSSGRVLGAFTFVLLAGLALYVGMSRGSRSEPAPAVTAEPDILGLQPPPPAPPTTHPAAAKPPPTPEERQLAEQREQALRDRRVRYRMTKVPITMYAKAACTDCDTARDWLQQQGLTFTEVDVQVDSAAERKLASLDPDGKVPTFDIEGEVVKGFSKEGINGALRRRAEHWVDSQ